MIIFTEKLYFPENFIAFLNKLSIDANSFVLNFERIKLKNKEENEIIL